MGYWILHERGGGTYDAPMNDGPISADDVRDFFARVLAGEADALRCIEEGPDELENRPQGFVFTLPALHALLDPQQFVDYREFRKRLYDSALNQELSAFDAEVVPFQSSGKVDSSRYCLRRRGVA